MIFLDSVFLFVFLKCLPVLVFVITITFATFVEWFSCLKSYWSVVAFSCQGRGGQVSPGVRREEIVYRDAPHLKRSEMFDELKLKDAYARLRLRPTKTRNSKKFEQLLPCSF